MSARYAIRAPQRGDIDEIVALCREHATFERADYAAEGKAVRLASALFGDHPRLWCRVAEAEDEGGSRLVGYAAYTLEYATWDAAPYMHLDCLYLRLEARGAGVGRRLMDAVIAEARPGLRARRVADAALERVGHRLLWAARRRRRGQGALHPRVRLARRARSLARGGAYASVG